MMAACFQVPAKESKTPTQTGQFDFELFWGNDRIALMANLLELPWNGPVPLLSKAENQDQPSDSDTYSLRARPSTRHSRLPEAKL